MKHFTIIRFSISSSVIVPASGSVSSRGAEVASVSARAMEWLRSQTWPGNIRQLRQTIDRAVLIRGGRELDVEDFFAVRDAAAAAPREETLPDAGTMTLDEMEKRMIVKCFKHYDGNVSRAALYRRMEKYGIEG